MSALTEHLGLFKADWIGKPDLLRQRIRAAKVADPYTAELAAWCAEIHEHLREAAEAVEVELLLMGGNGASLRFDAVKQRGSRDNDYLTAATPEDIRRLMERFGSRFALLGGLMQPHIYVPKRKVRELPLVTYVVPVQLVLDHGYSAHNEIKLEFHIEKELPAFETVTGRLGPAATPEITATLPELPYQITLKLMTFASQPVGIDEDIRAAAVPRQIYDVDMLLASLDDTCWLALCDYCHERYAHECARCEIEMLADEPFRGVRARLERWGNCLDEHAEPWGAIRAAQQSGLQRAVQLRPWGWRARAYRLILAVEALRRGADGWRIWQTANELADLVPASKARAFRAPLAELAAADARQIPVELRDFAWVALDAGRDGDPSAHLARASELLRGV